MEKPNLLKQLGLYIAAEQAGSELAQQATNLVMGDGNLDARIVFIGEAPGKNEDEQGIPFVGAAGKFLDELLDSAGLTRGDVYVTNIVKYRPPNNRDPTAAEKTAFLPYLAKELDIIKPELIVTLGRHSMGYFLPTAKIGQAHGVPVKVTVHGVEYTVLPLYHPAAALYNGGLRQALKDDFLQLATYNNK